MYLNMRKKMRFILGALVILSLLSTLLSFARWSYWTYRGAPPRFDPGDYDPIRPADSTDTPLEWKPLPHCRNTPYKFPKKTPEPLQLDRFLGLSIIEERGLTHKRQSAWSPQVFGEVILRPTHAHAPTLVLEVISNDESLDVRLQPSDEYSKFTIVTPQGVAWSDELAPCIQIRATVWVPVNTSAGHLFINTIGLDIVIKDGLRLSIAKDLLFDTFTGQILAPAPPKDIHDVLPYALLSASLSLHTISGDITGWYPLYTGLGFETQSGNVDVDVGIKDGGSIWRDEFVSLGIVTTSGDVRVRETYYCAPGDECIFPPRNYCALVDTASGDVDAHFAVTRVGDFKSQSGNMNLNLLPSFSEAFYDPSAWPLELLTDTKSGNVKLNVSDPIWLRVHQEHATPKPPSVFPISRSIHRSVSGNINLIYPSSWEGILSARTTSGTQNIRGEGLELANTGGRLVRRVQGKKGNGTSDIQIESISGNEDVLIGKEVGKDGQ